MFEVIAVIEDPKCCLNCPFCHIEPEEGYTCKLEKRKEEYMSLCFRPDWCPLKKIPEKLNEWDPELIEHQSLGLGKHIGWNMCIDEILGKDIEVDE